MRKIKIAINGSFIRKPDSGMGQVSLNFLKNLSERLEDGDFNQFEFIVYLEELTRENFSKKIKIKLIKSKFYKRDDLIRKIIWEKYLLPKVAKKDGVKIFISLYQSPTILSSKIKHLMLVHDVVPKVFPDYLNNFRKKFYYHLIDQAIKRVDQVLTVSENSKKEISRFYELKSNQIEVCPISTDPIFDKKPTTKEIDRVMKKFQLRKDWYIFYVGGFDLRKNVNELIEAHGRLCQELRNTDLNLPLPKLVLAGEYHYRLRPLVEDLPSKIKQVTESYQLDKNQIKLLGFVEQSDLPALYAGSRITCYPSLYEGFGLPVLEAMKIGATVVSSSETSLPEVAGDGAYLVSPGNALVLSQALKKLIMNKQLSDDFKKIAQKQAQKFNWDIFTDKIIEIIKNEN